MVYPRILIVVPCAIKEELVVYSMYNSLHLLISDSQWVPSAHTPALPSTSLLICQVLFCSPLSLGKQSCRSPYCQVRVLWSDMQVHIVEPRD